MGVDSGECHRLRRGASVVRARSRYDASVRYEPAGVDSGTVSFTLGAVRGEFGTKGDFRVPEFR